MKRRILFAGEHQPLWQEFRALADSVESQWLAEFALTRQESLELVRRNEFDAVVADTQVSGAEGVEVLDEIMRLQPKTLRIILSDLADSDATLRCIGRVHRHVLKPCDASMLVNALDQALSFEAWLPGIEVQRLIPQMRWLPSPPSVYFQVMSEMRSPDASVEKIGELIAQDPAIMAKVLQLANSAVFGLQLQVVQPVEAVAYIGLETTKSLLLLAHTFSAFEPLQPAGFNVEALWRHSLYTAHLARMIASQQSEAPDLAEQAFAAGLLHDIGKLLFAANLSKQFGEALTMVREYRCSMWEAENRLFGACHAEVGACLLGIWGLPTPVVEAVALHHFPGQPAEPVFSPLTAVHVANVLEHETQPEATHAAASELDLEYLSLLGVEGQVQEWRDRWLMDTSVSSA